MNKILRFSLVLFLVNLISASILSGVYNITRPTIEAQKLLLREEALRQVMPESVGDRLEAVREDGEIKYWNVFKGSGSRVQGYVFIAKKYGYSSVIETMVGMKKDATITGVRILSQNETPGLGAKIIETLSSETIVAAIKGLFSKEARVEKEILPYFTEQLKGVSARRIGLSKNGVEAITGATISSKACADSIKEKGLEILGN